MDSMKIIKVHHKIDSIIHPIYIVNPTNIIMSEVKVADSSGLLGPDNQPVPVTKVGIKFPMGVQIVTEETLEQVLALFNGDTDAPTGR